MECITTITEGPHSKRAGCSSSISPHVDQGKIHFPVVENVTLQIETVRTTLFVGRQLPPLTS